MDVTAEGTNGSTAGTSQAFTITKEDGTSGRQPCQRAECSEQHGDDQCHHVRFLRDRRVGNPVPGTRRCELQLHGELYGRHYGKPRHPPHICIDEANDGTSFTNVSGALVTDTTGGWQYVPPTGGITLG